MKQRTPAKDKRGITRRRALHKAGTVAAGLAAGGALTLGQGAPAKQPARKMEKVRIGVVGGGFGQAFPWHEHPDC
ncbi:MAG: hypothetical protein WBF17_04695, partial [Phycisphaerae bacterium]